jgi:cyclic di-GMP phosphodiesterase
VSERILVVDDVEQNLQLVGDLVQSLGYQVETARDGIEALAKLALDVDLVLLDVLMPGIDGFEVTRRIRADPALRSLPVLMVTALDSRQDRLRAVEAGADDFVTKPVERTELQVRIKAQLALKAAQKRLEREESEMEETIERRTAALRKTLEETADHQLRTYEAYLATVHCLVFAAGLREGPDAGSAPRVGRFSAALARALGRPAGEVEILRHAAPLRDVGKLGIPDAILLKRRMLTAKERRIMESHTLIGARLLAGSPSELLQAGEVIALTHHERWDGKGYPQGLQGKEIPLWGRICAVADFFCDLPSERLYRQALSTGQEALASFQQGRGSRFDPELCDLLREPEVLAALLLEAGREEEAAGGRDWTPPIRPGRRSAS